jgi:hypothetical protein
MKLDRARLSDFQIPAQFTKARGSHAPAFRGGETKRTPEGVREMAVTGIAQVERQSRQIGCSPMNPLQCCAKTKTISILMNAQTDLATENTGEMEGRDVNRRGDVIERQIFCKTRGQKQSGRFRAFTMRLRRRNAASPRPNIACAVSVSEHSIEEGQSGFFNRQAVILAREQKLAQPLVQQKSSLTAQRVPKLERLLPFSMLPEQSNGLHQNFRAEREHRTIVTALNGMRHAVGFLPVEKQNVIRVGHEITASLPLHERAGTHEDNLVRFTPLLATTRATMWPAANIRDGHHSTAVQRGNSQVSRHIPIETQTRQHRKPMNRGC